MSRTLNGCVFTTGTEIPMMAQLLRDVMDDPSLTADDPGESIDAWTVDEVEFDQGPCSPMRVRSDE